MKRKKIAAILLVIVIVASMLPSSMNPSVVQAAVLGDAGTIPSGGTPGANGGVNLNAAYRVSLVKETLNEKDKLIINLNNDQVEERLRRHYNNHFPKMENSILFAPASNYTQNALIGWYSSSAGTLNYATQDANYMASKLRQIGSSTRDTPIFYSKLDSLAPYDKEKDNLTKLANGKWKNVIDWNTTCTISCANLAAPVWNWILQDSDQINKRIKNFTNDDLLNGNDADKYEARLHYLDLLISLYVLAPTDDKPFYEAEINRYIDKKNLDTNPLLIAIDTVSRFSVPKYSSKYLFIPSIDFVLWAHGATPKNDLRESSFNNGNAVNGTKEMIKLSADKSIAELPGRDRITSKSAKGNGFAYGYNGVTGWGFSTASGKGVWGSRGSVVSGIMESIKFDSSGSYYGFMIAGGAQNKIDPPPGDCECSQTVSLKDGKKPAEVNYEIKTDTIGKKISMPIDLKQSEQVVEEWKKFMAPVLGRKDFKLKVTLHRSYREGGDGSTAKWSKDNGPAPGVEVKVTPDELISYLSGKSTLMYTDDLVNYPMPEGSSVTFAYNATITISWTKAGKIESKTCSTRLAKSPEITFWRDSPPPPEKEIGTYTSVPKFWSEIKEGSPSLTGTGSNETFEAMAGTPTTRSLFFASGGSEYIVDVEVEYVPDATSTRTYRSFFSGGVPSEFKIGDQAKDYTVPSPNGASSSSLTVNAHQGGTVTATWTGTLPYTGSVTWGDHWTNINNKWDYAAYNTAKSQASVWASSLNAHTIKHTAASDGQVRSFNGWGASITADSKVEPGGTAIPGQPYVAPTPCSGDPCTGGDPGQPYIAASGTNGSNGTYSITVTGTLPARIIDGPSSLYDLPMVQDTWTQTVKYDYTKINKARVWKLDKSKVDGMEDITGTEEITASIVQGDPTIFANIADESRLPTQASLQGRFRYEVETNQHDVVVWNEGPRTNKDDGRGNNGLITGPGQTASWAKGTIYTNGTYSDSPNYHASNSTAKDKLTDEYKKFDERRKTLGEVTVVSDFLILQTSTGDQAVMYFDKTSAKVETQKQIDVPKTSFDTQWSNNPTSAAKWKPDAINIGSYNGNYQNPNTKYSGANMGVVKTVFDTMPAGKVRTPKPAAPLRLMKTGVSPIRENPNGLYITGTSSVFYKLVMSNGDGTTPYSVAIDAAYGAAGVSFMSTYSDSHNKVNDIVLHDPVSVEKSMVIPLPASRDQRTNASKAIGGNLQPPIVEYEKILDPNYRQNILANGDAELVNSDGSVAGWQKWTEAPAAEVTFTSRSGDNWVISGSKSFEIHTVPKKNITAVYYKDVKVKPDTSYTFTGDISCHRCEGSFYIDAYNSAGAVAHLGGAAPVVNTGTVTNREISFTTSSDVSYVRIHIVKGASSGEIDMTEHMFADNLSLQNMSLQEFIPTEPIYGTQLIPNPDYSAAPKITEFSYTGDVQTFTADKTGVHTFQVWGAQGGSYSAGNGGKGGYATGSYQLIAGESLHVYVGGTTSSGTGGWNGGGTTFGVAKGGGGASDIRKAGTKLIVAGGGGGAQAGAGGAGGGLSGEAGTRACCGTVGQGGTQTAGGTGGGMPGTAGQGGNGSTGGDGYYGGAGGGGYYGGGGANTDYSLVDDGGGGGGSSFIGGVNGGSTLSGSQSMPAPGGGIQTGHTGNGYIEILSPARANVPEFLEIETVLDAGASSPPDSAYILKEVKSSSADPVTVPGLGQFAPGNFINLDYGFQIYFPNSGDFYGNGASGIAAVTAERGKGFVNNMDTTEWTESKAVKFEFNVIYNNQTHAAGEWIDLPVSCNDFQCRYDFYLPLGNKEAMSALVEFKAIAINGIALDNTAPTNKVRDVSLQARHSAYRGYNIDVVGRIGNFVIEDTGDFRFSNLFKQPLTPTQWFVPNVVKKVNADSQNRIIGDTVDIRGIAVSRETDYLNTYGLLSHMNQSPIPKPLSPDKNNIAALRKQPMRMGYSVLSDLQTIGNYYDSVQIIPYYYALNLQNGSIAEVDVYMNVDGAYKPINKSGAAVPDWDPNTIYPYIYRLDWGKESGRRNVLAQEAAVTNRVMEYANTSDPGEAHSLTQPYGDQYAFGTAQIMYLTGRNRTFMGSTHTYGENNNPGGVIQEEMFQMQAQRWHFKYGLPSSAVVVGKGKKPAQGNIDVYKNNTTVILMAADVKALGDTYALQYSYPDQNSSVNIAGTTWPITSIPYPVLNVFSANKSSANDLEIAGTH